MTSATSALVCVACGSAITTPAVYQYKNLSAYDPMAPLARYGPFHVGCAPYGDGLTFFDSDLPKEPAMTTVTETHAMIDLETLALTRDPVILQIAAVRFEAAPGGAIAEAEAFNAYPMFHSQGGGSISAATLAFWLRADATPREKIADALVNSVQPLLEVLHALGRWYHASPIAKVWSHGAAFDLAILDHAYATHGIPAPWRYKDIRDTRTLYDLAGPRPDLDPQHILWKATRAIVPHDALSDAIVQARDVQDALGRVRGPWENRP